MSFSLSVPASPSSPSSSSSKTNTVAITNIPRDYFQPRIVDLLRQHFEGYGDINRWVTLPGFGRILCVFEREQDAESAKRGCDPIVVSSQDRSSNTTLRVYRADPQPLTPSLSYLEPPALEKNFLISPPGSPPIGWEPIREDPPNDTPLADDLITALKKLQFNQQRRSSGPEMLLDPEEVEAGVGVFVENCDDPDDYDSDDEMQEKVWERESWKPVTAMPPLPKTMIPTAMPPMRSAIVV